MNKFKKLAANLIKNKLWCSEITYVVTEKVEAEKVGMPIQYVDSTEIQIKVVIKNVSKNLIDNINVLNTDKSFVLDALTVVPKIQDYIILDGKRHKIVTINPLGTLDNEATAYEIVMRLA